jgi:hypothetical protein
MKNTKVVCVKVKHLRPKYDNLKEWIDDENNVYIGRKGIIFITDPKTNKKERYPKNDSIFANPYKVDKDGTIEEVINMYIKYLTKKIKNKEITIEQILSLRGKRLGCWCKEKGDEMCHGDILMELLNHYENIK